MLDELLRIVEANDTVLILVAAVVAFPLVADRVYGTITVSDSGGAYYGGVLCQALSAH